MLVEGNLVAWGASLRGLAAKWEFRRGFPEVVDVDARTFLARADELFAAVPVRHARLLDVEGHLPRLSKCESLARLSALTVAASKLGNALPRRLALSPHLTQLRTLTSPATAWRRRGRALAASPYLAGLTELDLSENEIGPAGATPSPRGRTSPASSRWGCGRTPSAPPGPGRSRPRPG